MSATAPLGGLAVVAVVVGGVVAAGMLRAPSNVGPVAPGESPTPAPTSREVDGCPVTIPPQPGFVPPEPYPPEPLDFYESVWYGTAGLWTSLPTEGEVWRDLPEDNGRFGTKTQWWSEDYSLLDERADRIRVVGRRLDRPGSFSTESGGGGSRSDVGSFLLVGLEMPAGCWELTATYRGAELSYVVLVEGTEEQAPDRNAGGATAAFRTGSS
ncbi:MAG: hypothetical protein M3217_10440 [Actinomycetota bacterium]|nr:hypothetical protein [Actinomycetota bacterium]